MGNPIPGPESGKPYTDESGTLRCGSPLRNGKGFCGQKAGHRTDHPGEGRCWLHGGAPGSGRPIETGQYSRYGIIRSKDAAKYREHFERDPDPLNLLPDVLELRVRIADFCDRYDETTGALLAWHASWGTEWAQATQDWRRQYQNWHAQYAELLERVKELRKSDFTLADLEDPPPPPDPGDMMGRPRKLTDILQAGQFLGLVGGLIDKIKRREDERGYTVQDIDAIVKQHGVELVAALRETVEDDQLRDAILAAVADRWDPIPFAKTKRPQP